MLSSWPQPSGLFNEWELLRGTLFRCQWVGPAGQSVSPCSHAVGPPCKVVTPRRLSTRDAGGGEGWQGSGKPAGGGRGLVWDAPKFSGQQFSDTVTPPPPRALIRPSGEDAMGRSCILDSHPGRWMPIGAATG